MSSVDDAFGHLTASSRPEISSRRTANSSPPNRARGVADSKRLDEAPGDRDQQVVAGCVPEAVVDELEVVEVEEQNGQQGPRSSCPRQRVLQPVQEQGTIGKPAQRVVERLVFELFLEGFALAHVTHREDNPRDGGIAQQIVRYHLDVPPGTIVVPDAPLCRDR